MQEPYLFLESFQVPGSLLNAATCAIPFRPNEDSPGGRIFFQNGGVKFFTRMTPCAAQNFHCGIAKSIPFDHAGRLCQPNPCRRPGQLEENASHGIRRMVSGLR